MSTNDGINNPLAGNEGTGKYVGDQSPSLTTPDIGAATGTSLDLGSSTVIDGFIDDDTFATASATTGATSESIKAYADSLVASTGGLKSLQVFTSGGTWTKPAGINLIVVECQGAGGSGGGANSDGKIGSGGDGGSWGTILIDVRAISSETVTIGAGGTGSTGAGAAGGVSSFGAHISAAGGGGGALNGASFPSHTSCTGGDVNVDSTFGTGGGDASIAQGNDGFGSDSRFGSGGRRGSGGGGGFPGTGYGSGGGGGNRNTTTSRPGGHGTDGIVVVYEYS